MSFDIRRFLVENKLTKASKTIFENTRGVLNNILKDGFKTEVYVVDLTAAGRDDTDLTGILHEDTIDVSSMNDIYKYVTESPDFDLEYMREFYSEETLQVGELLRLSTTGDFDANGACIVNLGEETELFFVREDIKTGYSLGDVEELYDKVYSQTSE